MFLAVLSIAIMICAKSLQQLSCKVFVTSTPNIVQSPRILKFIGNPAALDDFISRNKKLVARLNDVDRSQVVAAGMLRGQF